MCLFAPGAVKEKKFRDITPNTQYWGKCFGCFEAQEEDWRGQLKAEELRLNF